MTLYSVMYHLPSGYRLASGDSNVPYHMIERALLAEPLGSWAKVWCANGERDEHVLRRTRDSVVREEDAS